jgi:peroxiredoxin
MTRLPSRLALSLIAIGVSVSSASFATAESAGKPVADFALTDAAGKSHNLYDLKGKKAIVAVFLSFECPVSNSYAPILAELSAKHASREVAFVGIDSSDDLDAEQTSKLAAERKLPFPVFADPARQAADRLGATTVPEVIVLNGNFIIQYRGRIDDGWSARLKKNATVAHHDLKDALEAVLAGRAVAEPVTKAVGCPILRAAAGSATTSVNYHRDVQPILEDRCQQCHRPGEVGPFSLMTYKQAVNWAADVKEYTQSRKMPPWKPVAGVSFHNERKLTEKEIATLAAWADGGTLEGDAKDAPPPRKFVDGWQLGPPDLVLTVPEEMTVGARGDDLFRCFVLPTNLVEDKYVVAMEVRPGNNKVVHHTLNFVDLSGQARRLEKQERERVKKAKEDDYGPGYSVAMGIGFLPQGNLAGWAPGQLARTLPDGTGYPLAKGSDVVIQVHYHRTGKVEKDRTSLGLYFARKPVAKPFKGMVIRGQFFIIPPDNPHFRVQGGIEVDQNCRLYSVMPHMHKLGREIAVTITPPAGEPSTLVAIKEWDYNWQETYLLKQPIDIKAGTKIRVEAFYDNSPSNPNSLSQGRLPVFFGEQTTNEMCFIFLGATSDSSGRIRAHQERGIGTPRVGGRRAAAAKAAGSSRQDAESAKPAGQEP